MYDLFHERQEEMEQRKEDLWFEIFAELSIEAGDYSLNHITGEVTISDDDTNPVAILKGILGGTPISEIKLRNEKEKGKQGTVLELVKNQKEDEPIH
jgi:hypothetical protein